MTATRSTAVMLIDAYMSEYDVGERHHTRVAASREATYAALWAANLANAPLARMLLALRALPAALGHGVTGMRTLWARGSEPITLSTFLEHRFHVLAELPPSELVIGVEGQFWRPAGNLCTPPSPDFRSRPPAPGTARGVWNFHLRALADGTTEVTTETRVQCADAAARRRFLPYWYAIRPASGMIRHAMLREIRRSAEARRSA